MVLKLSFDKFISCLLLTCVHLLMHELLPLNIIFYVKTEK